MNSKFPRVLLVAAKPFTNGATGTDVTLSNVLRDWPRDQLAHAFIGTASQDELFTGRGFPIDPKNVFLDHSFRHVVNSSGALRASTAPLTPGEPFTGGRDLRTRAHMAMRFAADASPVRIPAGVRSLIKEFAPDVVYSLLGSLRVIGMAGALSEELGVPVLPHFMDDWVNTLYTSGELWGIPKRILERRMDRLIRSAPCGVGISDPMSEEYSSHFGIPFTTVANPAHESFFSIPPPRNSDCRTVMYVGGLHLGRARALVEVADSLAQLPRGPGGRRETTLVVHCPDSHHRLYGAGLRNHDCITLAGSLAPREVPAALALADVLLHVESPDKDTISFTRLSVSTKISQYLASGRPILCYAPSHLASSRMVRESQSGLIADQIAELAAAFGLLRGNPELRQDMGRCGRAYASKRLSQDAVSELFLKTVRLASHGDLPLVPPA